MPFDANGNYTLPTIYIAIPGEVIKSTQHNTPFEDVQAAFNNTLCRDGRTPWTGNQNANNNKLTGLAKGTNSSDAVRMDQVATLDGETAFTGKVTVQDVDDWASNEPVPAKQADKRYVRLIDDDVNWPVQYAGINKKTNQPWFKSGPNYFMLQPAGDYATNAALNTETTNRASADSALDRQKLGYSGGQVNYLRVGTSLFVLGNECAVYNSAANAWVNTYVDSNGNAAWDLNGGSPDNNTGNKNWFRMAPDGHLSTGKGNVAFSGDLPFLDANLRQQVWVVDNCSDGDIIHIPTPFKTTLGVTGQDMTPESRHTSLNPVKIPSDYVAGNQFKVQIWSSGQNRRVLFVAYGYMS